jgi:hypothetical protein
MRPLAAAPVLFVALLGGCQKGGTSSTASHDAVAPTSAATATAAATTDPVTAPVAQGVGTPKTDPCTLLTKGIAEGALGLAVGPPAKVALPGNVTCAYHPADGRPNVFVLLTTYTGSGKAALLAATKKFPDATPVPNLGDAAYVSRRAHAIGVSVGDLIFGMSLLRVDGLDTAPAVIEAQLITVARTVVRSR